MTLKPIGGEAAGGGEAEVAAPMLHFNGAREQGVAKQDKRFGPGMMVDCWLLVLGHKEVASRLYNGAAGKARCSVDAPQRMVHHNSNSQVATSSGRRRRGGGSGGSRSEENTHQNQ